MPNAGTVIRGRRGHFFDGLNQWRRFLLETGGRAPRIESPSGVWCGEGVSPSLLGDRSGEEAVSPPQKSF